MFLNMIGRQLVLSQKDLAGSRYPMELVEVCASWPNAMVIKKKGFPKKISGILLWWRKNSLICETIYAISRKKWSSNCSCSLMNLPWGRYLWTVDKHIVVISGQQNTIVILECSILMNQNLAWLLNWWSTLMWRRVKRLEKEWKKWERGIRDNRDRSRQK